MKIGVASTNPLERILFAGAKVPLPFFDTWFTFMHARAIMVAVKLGLFEALASGPLNASEIAGRCETDPRATRILADALVSARYLQLQGNGYALTSLTQRWLLEGSRPSLRDITLHRFVDWERMGRLEEFVRTGEPLDIHSTMPQEEWELYQRGMRSLAPLAVAEMVRKVPVPTGARDLLDIGGSHGLYSVALCRRHPGLRAVVLDLPQAVEHAAPILAQEGMGDRVVHKAGNALTDDLGAEAYDLVLLIGVAHHFDLKENRDLAQRVARALRPGGYYIIHTSIRPEAPTPGGVGPIIGLLDLYYALTSASGSWSFEEMATWQRDAGLDPRRPLRSRRLPGTGWQVGEKPRG